MTRIAMAHRNTPRISDSRIPPALEGMQANERDGGHAGDHQPVDHTIPA